MFCAFLVRLLLFFDFDTDAKMYECQDIEYVCVQSSRKIKKPEMNTELFVTTEWMNVYLLLEVFVVFSLNIFAIFGNDFDFSNESIKGFCHLPVVIQNYKGDHRSTTTNLILLKTYIIWVKCRNEYTRSPRLGSKYQNVQHSHPTHCLMRERTSTADICIMHVDAFNRQEFVPTVASFALDLAQAKVTLLLPNE